MTETGTEAPPCGCCDHQLAEDEPQTCRACVGKVRADLHAITNSYALLPLLMAEAALTSNAPRRDQGRSNERPMPGGVFQTLLAKGSAGAAGLYLYLRGENPHWGQDDVPGDPPSVSYELFSWVTDWRRTRREDRSGAIAGRRGAGGKAPLPQMPDPCTPWEGRITPEGYGRITLENGSQIYAHRQAWEEANGPIPGGMTLDHLCLVTACVNVEHLELVTRSENIRRASLQITHCPSGHLYDEANTILYTQPKTGNAGRKCRACDGAWRRARRADRRGSWTVDESADYLIDHLQWAANRHPGFPDFAEDIRALRHSLEHATGTSDHPMRAEAPCIDCGGMLERKYRELTHRGTKEQGGGLDDDWTCRHCKRQYTEAAYYLAVRAMLEQQAMEAG